MRLRNQYTLAERLGKTLAEIRHLPEPEFIGWLALYAARDELAKESAK